MSGTNYGPAAAAAQEQARAENQVQMPPKSPIFAHGMGEVERRLVANLDLLADTCYRIAGSKGWHENDPRNFGEVIALIHSEASEAFEFHRKGDDAPSDHIPDFTGVEEEFADIIIRVLDAGVELQLRVPEAVIAKLEYNRTRTHKHGGKKC